ncbi:MAG: ATP-binding protein, partial [Actinomycetota bacterium]|nr:ATP-binding protein [Actinomycetota bacterium]
IVYLVGEGQTLRPFAVAHADPSKHELIQELQARYPLDLKRANMISTAIETGEAVLVPEVPREMMAELAVDEDHRRLLEAFGFASAMVVPLVAHGRTLGAIAFAAAEGARSFTETELEYAQELARRAAVAVDNARLFREAEERGNAARALETIADGVLMVDRAGVVRLWNPGAEAITGLGAAGVVGRPAVEAIPGWDDVAHRLPVADAPGPGGTRPETVPVEVGGRELWLSVSAVGFSEGTVYAFRDLTEERRLDQLKTEFVATASHELRTPLAAVYGAAMTLRRSDLAHDDDRRDLLLSVIADESDRLARIVNDILWASRLDSGELGIDIRPFDPRASAHRVIEAARTHLPPGVELELVAPQDVPPVAADESKVQQVITNLLENAIKYSPDGGRIEVRLEAVERRLRLSVADHGLGIPINEHSRIFEKFYRLDPNLTRGVGGTGLGLYICRELVRRMNGRIWLASRAGEGSTFWVELPLAET